MRGYVYAIFDGHGPYAFAGVFSDMESAITHFNSEGHTPQNTKLFHADQVPANVRRQAQKLAREEGTR